MSGVVTRSQSQGDKEESTMESPDRDGLMKVTSKSNSKPQIEGENAGLIEQEQDNAGSKLKGENRSALRKTVKAKSKQTNIVEDASDRNNQHAEVYKGYVADRVDKINSNPTTPVSSTKMPKAKSALSSRNRTLVSQNGQLGLQSTQGFAMALSQRLETEVTSQNIEPAEDNDADLTTILKELAGSVKKLENQINKMEKDRKSTDSKVSAVEVIQQQEVVKLRGVIDQLDDHDDRIQALMGVVIRQDQQIQALTNQVQAAQANRCTKNIIINGIPETQGENTIHEVAHFFKQILKISNHITIKHARRMGRGQYKPMLVKLQNVNDKAAIFQNLDKLKEINKSKDRPFFVTDHLPEAWAERKRYFHFLKQQNKKLPVAQQFKAQVRENKMFFNDKEYVPPVSAPTVRQFLSLSAERRRVIRELQVIQGDEETAEESIFIGYAAQVFSTKQVEDYYYHVRLLNPEATHVMCAFKLPGIDFTSSQGSIDDGEHAGGRTLLKHLLKDQNVNRAVYVVRYYGGKHLGPQRFSIIGRVAQSAITKLTEHEAAMRRPPTQQELDDYRKSLQQNQPYQAPWSTNTDEEDSQDEFNASQQSIESVTDK